MTGFCIPKGGLRRADWNFQRGASLKPSFVIPDFITVLLVIGGFSLSGAGSLWGCSRAERSARATDTAPAVPVVVAPVESKTVAVEYPSVGTVEAYATVVVRSMVAGELQAVHFREGDYVRQGDLLFTIDPEPYRTALAQAEAKLNQDRVLAQNAEREEARYADLLRQGIVTQEQYDRIRSNAEALRAAVQADEAAVANARLQLEYCFIRSPITGRAGALLVHAGNLIKANERDLVVIHQVEPIYVTFTVPQQYLPDIQVQSGRNPMPVVVTLPGHPEERFEGRLAFIDNAVDPTTGTIRLKARLENSTRGLWPGQLVNVALTLRVLRDAVVVPAQAVQAGQVGTYVYVVRSDRTAELRSIDVAHRLEQEVVVARGLRPGEQVVIDGQVRLTDGVKVQVQNLDPEPVGR
ncbi:MAG: efflux RND transporter periplasmic adaptor subunit [Acidobacteria bacterium]|nr:efflux RND transporter periplasmic adaptor subunit [Acidobacteriota bacterium]MDW7983060.1 efflux RND transporter periplasmic adaptor subunit [Acidobacteriota bacterium]